MTVHDEEMAPYHTLNPRPSMPQLRAECATAVRASATMRELIDKLGGPAAFLAKMARIGVTLNPHTVSAWHTGNRAPPQYVTQLLFLLLKKE